MEVEERVDDVRAHAARRLLVKLDALRDGVKQVAALRSINQCARATCDDQSINALVQHVMSQRRHTYSVHNYAVRVQ